MCNFTVEVKIIDSQKEVTPTTFALKFFSGEGPAEVFSTQYKNSSGQTYF